MIHKINRIIAILFEKPYYTDMIYPILQYVIQNNDNASVVENATNKIKEKGNIIGAYSTKKKEMIKKTMLVMSNLCD